MKLTLINQSRSVKVDSKITDRIKANPKKAKAYLGYSGFLFQEKRNKEALKEIDSAIKNEPTNADGYIRRAQIYAQKQEFGKAIDVLKKAPKDQGDSMKLKYLVTGTGRCGGRANTHKPIDLTDVFTFTTEGLNPENSDSLMTLAQRMHIVPINDVNWNMSVLHKMRDVYEYNHILDIQTSRLDLYYAPCCNTLATQIVSPNYMNPYQLFGNASVLNVVDQGEHYCCVLKPVNKKQEQTGPKKRTRKCVYQNDPEVCKNTMHTLYSAYGKMFRFANKPRHAYTEGVARSKKPIIITPCCFVWMRYDHTYWGPNGYMCPNCRRLTENSGDYATCCVCDVISKRREDKHFIIKVYDDLIFHTIVTKYVCTTCMIGCKLLAQQDTLFLASLLPVYRSLVKHNMFSIVPKRNATAEFLTHHRPKFKHHDYVCKQFKEKRKGQKKQIRVK